ncbi:hypothetical protein PR048_027917 [Dryococelus australis]|uniref:Uncharacterized protein n=1 Tax=Dryococelus australis TaxID=614101 RepID=A0ABQ9GHU7_9NEOP|nr:hypothetical protein PR048_027917 [Dryococelus australis]
MLSIPEPVLYPAPSLMLGRVLDWNACLLYREVVRFQKEESDIAWPEVSVEQGDPEKTCRPAASPGTIPMCENPEETASKIEHGSRWWEELPPGTLLCTGKCWLSVKRIFKTRFDGRCRIGLLPIAVPSLPRRRRAFWYSFIVDLQLLKNRTFTYRTLNSFDHGVKCKERVPDSRQPSATNWVGVRAITFSNRADSELNKCRSSASWASNVEIVCKETGPCFPLALATTSAARCLQGPGFSRELGAVVSELRPSYKGRAVGQWCARGRRRRPRRERKLGLAVLGTLSFVLRGYVYLDALGRLDVYLTFPAPLHSIKWDFGYFFSPISHLEAFACWGCGGVVVRLLHSHPGEPGSIPGGLLLRFSHMVSFPAVLPGFPRVTRRPAAKPCRAPEARRAEVQRGERSCSAASGNWSPGGAGGSGRIRARAARPRPPSSVVRVGSFERFVNHSPAHLYSRPGERRWPVRALPGKKFYKRLDVPSGHKEVLQRRWEIQDAHDYHSVDSHPSKWPRPTLLNYGNRKNARLTGRYGRRHRIPRQTFDECVSVKACQHSAVPVDVDVARRQLTTFALETDDITYLYRPTRSSDLSPIQRVRDEFGHRTVRFTMPSETIQEPRVALMQRCNFIIPKSARQSSILRGSQLYCTLRCRGDVVVRLLASHVGEPGSIPGGFAPEFSHVGTVPDDAAGWRVFSGISLHFGAAAFLTSLHPHRLPRLHSLIVANSRSHQLCDERREDFPCKISVRKYLTTNARKPLLRARNPCEDGSRPNFSTHSIFRPPAANVAGVCSQTARFRFAADRVGLKRPTGDVALPSQCQDTRRVSHVRVANSWIEKIPQISPAPPPPPRMRNFPPILATKLGGKNFELATLSHVRGGGRSGSAILVSGDVTGLHLKQRR